MARPAFGGSGIVALKDRTDQMEPTAGEVKTGRLSCVVNQLGGLGKIDAEGIRQSHKRGGKYLIRCSFEVATLIARACRPPRKRSEALAGYIGIMLDLPSPDRSSHAACPLRDNLLLSRAPRKLTCRPSDRAAHLNPLHCNGPADIPLKRMRAAYAPPSPRLIPR